MSRKIFKIVFLFALGALASGLRPGAAAADAKQFQQANDLYKSEKYDEAAKIYESLVAGSISEERAVLYFNLGNSHYRAGQFSRAIYDYERALALRPRYGDALYNLGNARAKLDYKIEDRRNLFMRLNDMALKWIRPGEFAIWTLFFLLVFLISAAFWLRSSQSRHFWAFPRGECFVLFCILAVLWGAQFFYRKSYAEAIVLAPEAEVRYGPSSDNQSLMKLGGGLKVYVVDAREDWSRVVTGNGETGWMKNSEIGRVNG